MHTSLGALLASGQPIVADGAMGTMLFSLGLQRGESPERWNIERPDAVRTVYRAYIEAGSQIILTNTFGGNRLRLAMHHLENRVTEINQAAAQAARLEADAAAHPVAVGGSIGPTGHMLAPMGTLEFDDAAGIFEEQARALIAGGVDVLWIETMSDLEEIRAAIEGARRVDPSFPLTATLTFDTKGRTMMGTTPEQALNTLSQWGVIALGANCGNGPDELETAVRRMREAGAALPLIAKANAGLPHMQGDTPVYDATPEVMAAYALRVADLGARIIGACCGSTPDHIRAISHALRTGRQ